MIWTPTEAKIDEKSLKRIRSFYIGFLHMLEKHNTKIPATALFIRMHTEML